MTEYQNYKNKILDIQYILNSGSADIVDLQYILILVYESIFNISIDLQDEVKKVFNQIILPVDEQILTEEVNNPEYYFYLFAQIKNDLNNYNSIQENTKESIISLLIEIDGVIPQENNVSDFTDTSEKIISNPINISENTQAEEKETQECIGMCSVCKIKCYDKVEDNEPPTKELANIINHELDQKTEQFLKYKNNDILKDKHLNSKYLKDYLIHNNLITNECSICGLNSWQNNYLLLELDYIDQDVKNQDISNLRLLCPNCFSQVGYK